MMSSVALATLVAVTPAAKLALKGQNAVPIPRFPFKVGRESRGGRPPRPMVTNLRMDVAPQLNDLYLFEPPWLDLFQISREHFTIERDGERFVLTDRRSVCGTIVAGKVIGGNRQGGQAELRTGDEIVIGSSSSEYVI